MPASPAAVASAATLGAAGGTRTFIPPAALIIGGRGPKGAGRYVLLAAALGELGMDKIPGVPGRVEPPGLIGRVLTSGVSGHALAGRRGAAAAATAATVSALGTWRGRAEIGKATGLPDPAIAVAEDVLALTVAGLAVRSAPHDGGEADGQSGDAAEEPDNSVLAVARDVARGVAAAAAGTVAMTGAQLLYYKLSGAEQSRAPEKVVRKLLKEAAGVKVARKHRGKLNWAAHIGYGLSWGIPFGLIAGRDAKALPAGLGFGGAVWLASLVELPALGQAPPVWEMEVEHLALDAGFHLVYGLASGAAIAALP